MNRLCSRFALASDLRAMRRLKTGFILVRLLPTYLVLAVLKHLVPLRWLAKWAWRPPAGPRDREAERRLAASVLRLSHLMGLPERDCLQRSLLLYRVLSRAGADPTLVVGFRQTNGCIRGHAWVTADHVVIEADAHLLGLSPAFRFGLGGELLPDPSDQTTV